MAEHAEFEQDLGDVLYSSLKPDIIPARDLKFHNEELGEGFFGVVLKAEYLPKKMLVAAKFLKGTLVRDITWMSVLLMHLAKWISALGQLTDSHLVKCPHQRI